MSGDADACLSHAPLGYKICSHDGHDTTFSINIHISRTGVNAQYMFAHDIGIDAWDWHV